jgi:hypothetical protein
LAEQIEILKKEIKAVKAKIIPALNVSIRET